MRARLLLHRDRGAKKVACAPAPALRKAAAGRNFGTPWLPHGEGRGWTRHATAAETVGAVRAAVAWTCEAAAPSRHALLYAFNEISEGGWLVPTLADGTAKVDALRRALGGNRSWTCPPPR